MNMGTVKVYARLSRGYLKNMGDNVEADHVFLVSDRQNNWNCFGGGIEEEGRKNVRLLGVVSGNLEWMARAYGKDSEGRPGGGASGRPAAGIIEKFNGTCQHAANRILAMAKEEFSVHAAKMNEMAVLLFGKYGFGVERFLESIERIADDLNRENPGSVSSDELSVVRDRLEKGTTPKEEVALLTDELPDTFATLRERCTSDQIDAFLRNYSAMQKRRQEAFDKLDMNALPNHDARAKMAEAIKDDLVGFLKKLESAIGLEPFFKLFHGTPRVALEQVFSER